MRIRISPEQLSLLESHDETSGMLPELLIRERHLMLVGDGERMADFRSQIMDLQVRIGFDENYNPTKSGRLLEDLIDKVFE